MPVEKIRGVDIGFEVLGDSGPWVALTPGGRRGMEAVRDLAALIAEAGYRVLIHDRRNTGASGVGFPGENESLEQAEDLAALMGALGTGPAFVGGSSSGSRLSLLLAEHNPALVTGLLLWRVTGGAFAAERLAFNYYGQYLEAVAAGGIEAVLASEHFAAMAQDNPVNAETLRQIGAAAFTTAMQRWLAGFQAGCIHPVAGIGPAAMRRIAVPALVVPGNDWTHPPEVAQAAHRLLRNSVYREVVTAQVDADVDAEGWDAATGRLAARFVDFLRAQEGA